MSRKENEFTNKIRVSNDYVFHEISLFQRDYSKIISTLNFDVSYIAKKPQSVIDLYEEGIL